MLKSIKIKNFYSINEEQEMSMAITSKDVLDESSRAIAGSAINLVSCIIGHNASGKTTVLKAITFLLWFVRNSYTKQKDEDVIPVYAHKLNRGQPTEIDLEFYDGEDLYKYYLQFNRREILQETLAKQSKRGFTSVFKLNRTKDGATIVVAKSIKLNETDKNRFAARRNVALFSCLIDTGYLSNPSFFKHSFSDVDYTRIGRARDAFMDIFHTSAILHKETSLRSEVLEFIRGIDIGISDFKFFETEIKEGVSSEKEQVLGLTHGSKKETFDLMVFEESAGTQHTLWLLSRILPALKNGGLVVVDEIDACLHPYVIKRILSLFGSKASNANNAQIIFSTHQHLLLNDRTKSQIFIAEKNEDEMRTELYRLDEVEGIRNDENYFHKYIAGAYGGTPKFNWL